jgi:hypothetical protein
MCNKELNDLCLPFTKHYSCDQIKEGGIGCGRGTYGEEENAYTTLLGKAKERGNWNTHAPIIIKWILNKQDGKTCTGFSCFRIGKSDRPFCVTDELPSSVKRGEYLDYLTNNWILQNYAPRS